MLFNAGLFGIPKEIFDTPNIVLHPNFSFTIFMAFIVSIASLCWAETVRDKQSMNISLLFIPYISALSTIFLAISNLPSAVLGIPFSSKVNPTTQAPYFLTKGKTDCRDFSFPFTELTIVLPL